MRPFVFSVGDLTGGLNESAPEMIADNELAVALNWYVDGPSIWTRPGYAIIGATAANSSPIEEILGAFLYDPDPTVSDDEIVLLGRRGSIAKLLGTTIVPLTIADGRIYSSSGYRWWGVQYGSEFFMCQRGNGGVKRILGSSIMEAGLSAPTVEPSVNDGGAGRMIAGKYRVCVRYYNRTTGAKSNWSPLSREITIGDNRCLAMSSIAVSSNSQVNARQIGATQPDGAIVYLVGQINDNVTTTFVLNALSPDDYGEADVNVNGEPITDTRNGLPPGQAWALELHKERLFVLNREGLQWSEAGNPQSFKPASFLPVTRGTGLIKYEEHGLVITTEKNAQILLGDTPSDFRTDSGNLSADHGCPAGRSLAIGDGILFWYTGVNIVQTQGSAPAILPKIERIRTTLDAIPDAQKGDVIGETISSRGWYVLSVPQATGRRLIVYDYRAGTFVGVFEAGPLSIARLLRENATEEKVYVSLDDDESLYEYLSGTSDAGAAVTAELRTKNFGYDTQAVRKITRRVNILSPAVNGTVTLKVYHDGTLVRTRSGLSLNRAGWKRFTVNTAGSPGSLVQLGVTYAGAPQAHIEQMQIEGTLIHGRRPNPV